MSNESESSSIGSRGHEKITPVNDPAKETDQTQQGNRDPDISKYSSKAVLEILKLLQDKVRGYENQLMLAALRESLVNATGTISSYLSNASMVLPRELKFFRDFLSDLACAVDLIPDATRGAEGMASTAVMALPRSADEVWQDAYDRGFQAGYERATSLQEEARTSVADRFSAPRSDLDQSE